MLINELDLDDSVIDMLVSFIKNNYDEIMKMPEWEEFYKKMVTHEDEKERQYFNKILLCINIRDAK